MKFLPILPLISRYPFLRVSAKVFKNLNAVKELEKRPEIIDAGKQIVLSAMDGKSCEREFDESDVFCVGCDEVCVDCKDVGSFSSCNLCMRCFENCKLRYGIEAEMKIAAVAKRAVLIYISSRMIVSQLEDWVRMRYAVSEASYYSTLMSRDSDAAIRLVATDLGIKLRGWNVHVASFVRASSRIRAENWRLVNRELHEGFVETTRRDVERVITELLRIRLFERAATSDVVKDAVEEVKLRAAREARKFEFDLGEVSIECLPPCMKEILSELQRGMNVPHTARFALTSFLLNIGMSVDDVVDLFKTAPDFDEEKTRYQVEHIAGERGKGVEYVSPSCDTMRTYQNCVSDCGVSHPINYYVKCKKRRRKS